MSHYFQRSHGLSRRSVALGGIITLHVLVIYMFANVLAITILPKPPQEFIANVMETVRPAPEVRPPSDPKLSPVMVQDVIRIPPIVLTPPDPPIASSLTGGEEPLIPAQPATTVREPPAPIRVLGQNRFPDSEDYYPPPLKRLGIEGAAVVRACVNEMGTLSGIPVIEQSSGNAGLDAGAMNVARAGRYARSVQGTTPVPNCFRVRVGFQMAKPSPR